MEEDFNFDVAGIVCTILTILGICLFLNFDDEWVLLPMVVPLPLMMSIFYILFIVGKIGIKVLDVIEKNNLVDENKFEKSKIYRIIAYFSIFILTFLSLIGLLGFIYIIYEIINLIVLLIVLLIF